MDDQHASRALASHIRSIGTSAAVGTLFLAYFGFGVLAEPGGTGLSGWSAWVFYQTLRIGAVLLAAAVVWCWTGQVHALVFEAAVTLAIGASLILTGVGMMLDGGGLQSVLNILFGGMFISSGLHSARLFASARRNRPTGDSPWEPEPQPAPHHVPTEELISSLRLSRKRDNEAATPPVSERRGAEPPPSKSSEPPPEGFLASFARKPPTDDNP